MCTYEYVCSSTIIWQKFMHCLELQNLLSRHAKGRIGGYFFPVVPYKGHETRKTFGERQDWCRQDQSTRARNMIHPNRDMVDKRHAQVVQNTDRVE